MLMFAYMEIQAVTFGHMKTVPFWHYAFAMMHCFYMFITVWTL